MIKKPFFSIAIPFYYRDENSLRQLYRCVDSIKKQTFQSYEIIVSTQNVYKRLRNDSILNQKVNLYNAENIKGFIQGNINYAIHFCSGKWIKILFSDDFFFDEYSLENIHRQLKTNKKQWAVMNSLHIKEGSQEIFKPIIPYFHKNILEVNTIGSPSAIAVRNSKKVLFDTKSWMRLDVDYYYALFQKFGKPLYIKNVYIVNEIHNKQFSALLLRKDNSIKLKLKDDLKYISKKYNYKNKNIFGLFFLRLFVKLDRLILLIIFKFLYKFKNINFNKILNAVFEFKYRKYYN